MSLGNSPLTAEQYLEIERKAEFKSDLRLSLRDLYQGILEA